MGVDKIPKKRVTFGQDIFEETMNTSISRIEKEMLKEPDTHFSYRKSFNMSNSSDLNTTVGNILMSSNNHEDEDFIKKREEHYSNEFPKDIWASQVKKSKSNKNSIKKKL